MFLDTGPLGPSWGEAPKRVCKSCQGAILDTHRVEDIRFPAGSEVEDMSGIYHADCSQPFASIARAMNMLSRFSM